MFFVARLPRLRASSEDGGAWSVHFLVVTETAAGTSFRGQRVHRGWKNESALLISLDEGVPRGIIYRKNPDVGNLPGEISVRWPSDTRKGWDYYSYYHVFLELFELLKILVNKLCFFTLKKLKTNSQCSSLRSALLKK